VSTAWDCTTTYRKEQPMTTYRDRLIAGIHDAPGTEADKTVADLKAALKALDQPVTGNKQELEQRLSEARKNA
jgi:predicted nucleic acid-binding Zn ribbon protein